MCFCCETNLDVLSLKVLNGGSEAAVGIEGAGDLTTLDDDAIANAHAVIILSKGRSLVDDSCSAGRSDVWITDNLERPLGLELLIVWCQFILLLLWGV